MISLVKRILHAICLWLICINLAFSQNYADDGKAKLSDNDALSKEQLLVNALVAAETSGDLNSTIFTLEALFGHYIKYDNYFDAERIGQMVIEKRKQSSLPIHELAYFYMRYSTSLIYSGRLADAQSSLNSGLALAKPEEWVLNYSLYFNKAFIYRQLGEYDLSLHFFSLAFQNIINQEAANDLLTECKYDQSALPVLSAKVLVQMSVLYAKQANNEAQATDTGRCAIEILAKSDDYYAIVGKSELAKILWSQNNIGESKEIAQSLVADQDIRHPQLIDMLTLLLNADTQSVEPNTLRIISQHLTGTSSEPFSHPIIERVNQLQQLLELPQNFYEVDLASYDTYIHPIKLMVVLNSLIRLHLQINENTIADQLFEKAQWLSEQYIHRGTDPAAWKSSRADLVDTYLGRFFEHEQLTSDSNAMQLVKLISDTYAHSPRRDIAFHRHAKVMGADETKVLYKKWIEQEKNVINQSRAEVIDLQLLAQSRDAFFTQLNNGKANTNAQKNVFSYHQTNLIPDDTIIYRYVITQNRSFVIVLAPRSLDVYPVPRAKLIDAAVNEFNDNLVASRAHSADLKATMSKILPVESLLDQDIKRLVIIADGGLHQLPFASLEVKQPSGELGYVVSAYSITHSFSISDYLSTQQVKADSSKFSIAVFADPYLSQTTGISKRLYETRNEALTIKQTFPNADIKLATGISANNSFLMSEDSRNSNVLHIATHGYYDPQNPEIIGLVTSAESKDKPNGFLSMNELLGYPVTNQLVFIAGCETNLGKIYASAGVKSMSRGFIAQGAGAVLATLWPVQDRATSKFVAQFYSNLLAENGDIANALKATQYQFSRYGRYRQPKYWAGFVVHASNKNLVRLDIQS